MHEKEQSASDMTCELSLALCFPTKQRERERVKKESNIRPEVLLVRPRSATNLSADDIQPLTLEKITRPHLLLPHAMRAISISLYKNLSDLAILLLSVSGTWLKCGSANNFILRRANLSKLDSRRISPLMCPKGSWAEQDISPACELFPS
jgi:hypothetical protein